MMMMIRPHRRRIRIVQSYLLGSANMHPHLIVDCLGPHKSAPRQHSIGFTTARLSLPHYDQFNVFARCRQCALSSETSLPGAPRVHTPSDISTRSSRHIIPFTLQSAGRSPPKLALLWGRSATEIHIPKQYLDRFIRFCRAPGRNQQINRPRKHATFVAIVRILQCLSY